MRRLAILTTTWLMLLTAADAQSTESVTVTMHNDDGFYFLIDGGPEKNPTLRLEEGRTYAFDVRNEGSAAHDFNLGELGSTRLLDPGESETLTVTVIGGPDAYWCNPHRTAGMQGNVEITGASDDTPGLASLAAIAAIAGAAALHRIQRRP